MSSVSTGFVGAVAGPRPNQAYTPGYMSEIMQWAMLGGGGGPSVTVTSGGTGSLASANTINQSAVTPSNRQLQVAGVGNVLRIIYGQVRLGADIALIRYSGDTWYILAVWGKGPIEGLQQYWVNDADPDATITATHYTGTQTQMPDPTLQTLLAAEGKVYADRLLGVAYSVFVIPAAVSAGFPTLAALLNGRKLYDPRADSTNGGSGAQRLADETTWVYSNNPALALADFRCQLVGRTMSWSSVFLAANDADTLCGVSPSQEKKRLIAFALERAQSASQWTETLRTYAGCMIVPDADGEMLVPLNAGSLTEFEALLIDGSITDHLLIEGSATDILLLDPATATTTGMSFDHSNIVAGTLKAKKRGIQQVPRYVEVQFTDTGSTPYIAGFATAVAAGLTWATAAPSKIALTGITRYSQAYREAVERLNQFLLADLSVTFTSHDEAALQLQVGTLIDITSSVFGWVNKTFRVDVAPAVKSGPGIARYDISAVEYDPAVYSETVSANPTTPDTVLGSPTSPPAIAGLSVAEEPYVEQFAVTATQARLTWTRPVWPFLASYWVTADIDGVRQWETVVLPSGDATDVAVTPKLRPGELYSFGVAARSSVATGTRTFVGLRPVGKSNPPSDVASISGFSVGGETFLSWVEATDDDQIHIRYELRYGATSGSWDDATTIQKIAALHYSVPGIPVGTWRFYVKAIDSIGQLSTNAAYVDLDVEDTGPFAVTDVTLSAPTVSNMTRNDIASQPEPCWVTDVGDVMGYGHVDTADATGVWIDANVLVGDLFVKPTAAANSSWTSETYDVGAIINASWAATLPYRALTGGVDFTLYLSDDNATWTPYSGGVALNVAARYAYIEAVNTTSGDVFSVDGYGLLQIVQVGAASLRPSAVTTEALTSDTSVTVTIEGTTYKLLAKA